MKYPRHIRLWLVSLFGLMMLVSCPQKARAQINTERVMIIGRNALYFNDYILSIQYFNQVIKAKPWMADPYFYRAVAKLSLEDYRGAEDDCTAALERNPFMTNAYYCRSYARMNQNKFELAVEDCTKGLEFDTENKGLMLNRAISRLYAHQYDSARIDLDDMIARYPRYMYAYMSRGQLCIEVNDTLGAIDDFSRAISVDRYYAPAYAARGYVTLLQERYADAIPDLNEAIRLEPDNEGYYVNRGLARYYNKDYRGVLNDFDRVLQLNPKSVMTYYNRGLILAEVGDDNRAIEDFDKVIELEPENDMAIYNRALLREGTGDLKGAKEDLDVIIERYPNFIPAYYQRSSVYKKMGNAKGSDRDYFKAWELEDKLKEARAAGKKFSARGDEAEAEDDSNGKTRKLSEKDINKYNRVIVSETDMEQTARYANPIRGNIQNFNVDVTVAPMYNLTYYEEQGPVGQRRPMSCQTYLDELQVAGTNTANLLMTNAEKALTHDEIDRHFVSIDHLSQLINEYPDNAAYYFARAIDFSLVKDMDNAIADLDKAIFLNGKLLLAYFERANLRFRQLMFDQSESQTDTETEAVTIKSDKTANPSQPLLGNLSISEGTFGAAYMQVMQDYDKVLQLSPDFVYAWYNRGNIRVQQKDYRSALEDYNKAIELAPGFAQAWYNRGITRIYLGEREDGLRDLSRAGELGLYKAYNIIKRFSE